ncbi:MAG: DegT/DnrJ/EryC1/StrS family aminotransferase [Thermoanaerobaculia bacterium]
MNFFHTRISPQAIEFAQAALSSGFVSEGKLVRQFEGELSSQLGLIGPVALNSGSSALHLGLVVAGVGAGDEVILPAQTFVASGLSIVMCGAKPVFADIQRYSGNLDPGAIRAKITPRTKAIMPVHWGGYPCDMDELNAVAGEHGLAVIEDAAHALGATYKGRPVGALSRFTAFSFQAIKHLTTGDGGALCCLGDADREEARRRRWFGIDRVRDVATILGEREYDLETVGFKYHLNDVAAAIGLGNLPGLPLALARHRAIAARYRNELRSIPGLDLLECRPDRNGSWWLFTVLVERREDFVRALSGRDVPTSVVHLRIDRNRVLGGVQSDLVNQGWFNDRQVALPVHVGLCDEDVEQVICAVRAGW